MVDLCPPAPFLAAQDPTTCLLAHGSIYDLGGTLVWELLLPRSRNQCRGWGLPGCMQVEGAISRSFQRLPEAPVISDPPSL